MIFIDKVTFVKSDKYLFKWQSPESPAQNRFDILNQIKQIKRLRQDICKTQFNDFIKFGVIRMSGGNDNL